MLLKNISKISLIWTQKPWPFGPGQNPYGSAAWAVFEISVAKTEQSVKPESLAPVSAFKRFLYSPAPITLQIGYFEFEITTPMAR
jgi:hypothetical protein